MTAAPRRLVAPDDPKPEQSRPAGKPATASPARLPIRRGLFGLRLWPDTVVLLLLFAASLALLYGLTQHRQAVTPGTTQAPPPRQSVTTAITVTAPVSGALFHSGDAIGGTALASGGTIYYRVRDASGRVLISDATQTADAARRSAFTAHPSFSATTRTGTVEVYGFDPAGGEANKQLISVRFR